jgi:hypothetical protein
MNYGSLAGILVTLALLLLAIESYFGRDPSHSDGFIFLYGGGVLCWLMLGVLMDNSALVIISGLQILFLAIFRLNERSRHD